MTLQTPCASFAILWAGAPTSNSPETVTSRALGAAIRNVTRRSGCTSGERTAGVWLAGAAGGCCASPTSTSMQAARIGEDGAGSHRVNSPAESLRTRRAGVNVIMRGNGPRARERFHELRAQPNAVGRRYSPPRAVAFHQDVRAASIHREPTRGASKHDALSYVLSAVALGSGRAHPLAARPADGRHAAARDALRSRRGRRVDRWAAAGRLSSPSSDTSPARISSSRLAASLVFEGVGDVVGLVAYLFTCALIIGFGQATRRRAGQGQRAARVAAGHAAEHRRCGHHDRCRGTRHLPQRRGRNPDRLEPGGGARPAARHRVPDRQRRDAPARGEPGDDELSAKASSSAWRITRC